MSESIERYDAFTYATAEAQAEAPAPVQLVETDNARTLIGYAVVWGAVSDIRPDGHRHRFERGSIIWAPTVNALWSHSPASPLATTANGTLRMAEDDYGVRVELDLDDTTDGENTLKRVKSRVARGMSFGGNRVEARATADPMVLNITRFIGREVTVTIVPAMTETQIVTAANAATMQAARDRKIAQNKLSRARLTMLKPGRVSG